MPDRARPRAVHLTSVHRPFDSRIFHKECRTLLAAGFDVALVAAHDRDEMVDGVHVVPIPKVGRRLARFWRSGWDVLRRATELDGDVYHFHDPELIPVGLVLRLRGKRVIYDVHEDLPRDVLDKAWIPAWLRRVVAAAAGGVEAVAVRCLDAVVWANPEVPRRFPSRSTVRVRNLPVVGELSQEGARPYRSRPYEAVYVGGLTASRGAREMVEAMADLPPGRDAALVLAGEFEPPELAARLADLAGWEHVSAVGWQDRAGVARVLSRARVGLVTLHPTPAYPWAYPVKLFEYMAAGLPVVASDFPVWRRVVEGAGCGLLVDPMDPAAIAKAIDWIFAHPDEAEAMGRRGKEAVLTHYNWEAEGRILVALYRRLLGAPA